MKKTLVLSMIICGSMSLALSGCGKDDGSAESGSTAGTASSTTNTNTTDNMDDETTGDDMDTTGDGGGDTTTTTPTSDGLRGCVRVRSLRAGLSRR